MAAVLAACGESASLPPGSPVADSVTTPSLESSASASSDPVDSGSLGTQPEDVSTSLDSEPPSSASPDTAPVADPGCTPLTVQTGDTQIVGERCDPGAFFAGARPAVLILNGCGGYLADAVIGRRIAAALVREGIVSVRIDYLGAAGLLAACDGALTDLRASAEPILRAVADTTELLRLDPTIDADAIGAVGYSLGAVTVMSAVLGGAGLAPIEPVPLSAVALLSYPNLLPEIPAALASGDGPALFMISGDIDQSAPPEDSQAMVDASFVGGVPVEQLVVSGQGHSWSGPAASLVGSVIADELADRLVD